MLNFFSISNRMCRLKESKLKKTIRSSFIFLAFFTFALFSYTLFSFPTESAKPDKANQLIKPSESTETEESVENDNGYYAKIPRFSSPPKIDGKLDNPLWDEALALESFTQYQPQEGARPSEKTVALLGFDDKNLYIAMQCFDSNPKALRACLTKRDKNEGDDEIHIYLDTFDDKKRAFVFQMNPCGVQTDGIFTDTQKKIRRGEVVSDIDKNWDGYFTSDAQIDDKGYTVEMAIPFKSLRFPNTQNQVWGLQIMRKIPRKNEEIYWSPRSRDVNGFLIQSGKLEIEGKIERGRNFEVMPVVTALKQSGDKFDPEQGLNLKYGITSDLTADITYNPDFSQVESDIPQNEVNRRYPIKYPEKRPFFLEGFDFFQTPIELVYTRKIVNPQWGIKLTGKSGKTTIGFLSTADESPSGIDVPGISDSLDMDSQKAAVNIFRLKRDLYSESYVGFTLTDKQMGDSWSSLSKNYNRVVGVDGLFKFKEYYRFNFHIVSSLSKVGNVNTGIVPAYQITLSRISRHWDLYFYWKGLPADFDAASGFFMRKDIKSFHARITYNFLPQTDLFVSISPRFEYRRIYNLANVFTDEQFNFSSTIVGWRQSRLWFCLYNKLETWEGIIFRQRSFRANLISNPFSWLSGNLIFQLGDGIYYSESPYLGYKTELSGNMTIKPMSNFQLFYNFSRNRFLKERGGEEVYTINIISQHIRFQFSRNLSLRLITDFNDYDKKLYNSFLFSYEYRPGTVLYLGIDDNQEKNDAGIFRSSGRFYFIKFSYWWRM